MKAADFIRSMSSSKDRPPVVILLGEDGFQADYAYAALKKRMESEGLLGHCEEKRDGVDLDAYELVMSLKTVSLFGNQRLIRVQHADKIAKEALNILADYAKSPRRQSCLVLIATKVDGRLGGWKKLKKLAVTVECKPLPQHQLPGWVRKRAYTEYRQNYTEPASEMLVELVGDSLSLLDDAITRIGLAYGEQAPIDTPQVDETICDTRDRIVFELSDAILERDLERALYYCDTLLDQKESPILMNFLVVKSIRQLLKLKSALADGVRDRKQLALDAGVPPFKLSAYQAAARLYRTEELLRFHKAALENDIAMKSQALPTDLLIKNLLTRICLRVSTAPRDRAPAAAGSR